MARRKIREYDAKRLLQCCRPELLPQERILVTVHTDWEELPQKHPWLQNRRLVVKPDQVFGQRKKLGLVLLDASYPEAQQFIKEKMNKEIRIGKATGQLTHFLVEPFVPHTEEYYLAFSSHREGDEVYFSSMGGIEVEEKWEHVQKFLVPTGEPFPASILEKVFSSSFSEEKRRNLMAFIPDMLQAYRQLDFTFLEFNPCTFTSQGQVVLLDTVAEIDDCASFLHPEEWKYLSFPAPFGKKAYPEEEHIAALDTESGASLKLTVLNPLGRIWNILSGGGASIIYLDTIARLGKQEEIANYGEYSGNPTLEESYHYARTVLNLLTRESHPQGKVLLIGGAIANFTDVEQTFTGIIKALQEYQDQLRKGKVSLFVRRGGPNYEKGLQLMERAGKEMGLSIIVQGPDTAMTALVEKALERIS